MAKTSNLTRSTYDIITNFVRSQGVRGRVTEKDIVKMGFAENLTNNGDTVYTLEVRQALAQAFNRGKGAKDFSEFLGIIAHKEEVMDKRGDDDFSDLYSAITGKEKTAIEFYNGKVKAFESLIDNSIITSGKLPKMIKDGDVTIKDFWALMSSANYTEKTMKESKPYLESLGEAQKFLLKDGSGLQNLDAEEEIHYGHETLDMLSRIGVVIDGESEFVNDEDITLEDAITGSLAVKVFGFDRDDEVLFDRVRRDKLADLSNVGMRAQAIAGKQTYSVIAASLVKETLGLLPEGEGLHSRNLTIEQQKRLESILTLDKKDDMSSILTRIDGYANYIYNILHPEDNPDFKNVIDGAHTEGQFVNHMLQEWMQNQTIDYSSLAQKINRSCIEQGVYAERTSKDFLKSLIVATSNSNLGFRPDSILQFNNEVPYMNEYNAFYPNKNLELPLTLVTENGVYTTSVEYTEEIANMVQSNQEALLDIAKKKIWNPETKQGSNPEANLRFLTERNLVIGSNPILSQVLYRYNEKEQNENSELTLGNGKDGLGAKKTRQESKPCLYRDTVQYKKYKEEASDKIRRFLCLPSKYDQQQGSPLQQPPSQPILQPQLTPQPPQQPTPQPIPQPQPAPAPQDPREVKFSYKPQESSQEPKEDIGEINSNQNDIGEIVMSFKSQYQGVKERFKEMDINDIINFAQSNNLDVENMVNQWINVNSEGMETSNNLGQTGSENLTGSETQPIKNFDQDELREMDVEDIIGFATENDLDPGELIGQWINLQNPDKAVDKADQSGKDDTEDLGPEQ